MCLKWHISVEDGYNNDSAIIICFQYTILLNQILTFVRYACCLLADCKSIQATHAGPGLSATGHRTSNDEVNTAGRSHFEQEALYPSESPKRGRVHWLNKRGSSPLDDR